jgi:putative transposase
VKRSKYAEEHADAKEKIDAWRTYYNEVRPHSALKWQAPAEYARQHLASG